MLLDLVIGLIILFIVLTIFILPLLGFFAGFELEILDEKKHGLEGARLIDSR